MLKACQTAGVQVQFLGNVWGMDENAMKAAGTAANGVVFPLRTAATWTDKAPGMALMKEISRMSDPSGNAYRPIHYLAGVCTALFMKEAIEWAAANGGVTGENIRNGMYARQNWVPKGAEGVCKASRWTAEDHRGMLQVDLYRAEVKGADRRAGRRSHRARLDQDGQGRNHRFAAQERVAGLVRPQRRGSRGIPP